MEKFIALWREGHDDGFEILDDLRSAEISFMLLTKNCDTVRLFKAEMIDEFRKWSSVRVSEPEPPIDTCAIGDGYLRAVIVEALKRTAMAKVGGGCLVADDGALRIVPLNTRVEEKYIVAMAVRIGDGIQVTFGNGRQGTVKLR
jgi:hypothetical protein